SRSAARTLYKCGGGTKPTYSNANTPVRVPPFRRSSEPGCWWPTASYTWPTTGWARAAGPRAKLTNAPRKNASAPRRNANAPCVWSSNDASPRSSSAPGRGKAAPTDESSQLVDQQAIARRRALGEAEVMAMVREQQDLNALSQLAEHGQRRARALFVEVN